MFCQKCGNENKDDAKFCNSCATALTPVSGQPSPSKHNEVIKTKIASRNDEIWGINFSITPAILIVIGIIISFFGFVVWGVNNRLIVIIVGILILISGFWLNHSRGSQKKKLQNEIKELEAELE